MDFPIKGINEKNRSPAERGSGQKSAYVPRLFVYCGYLRVQLLTRLNKFNKIVITW